MFTSIFIQFGLAAIQGFRITRVVLTQLKFKRLKTQDPSIIFFFGKVNLVYSHDVFQYEADGFIARYSCFILSFFGPTVGCILQYISFLE